MPSLKSPGSPGAPVLADTIVSTDTTRALTTSRAGDVTVTEDGSIALTITPDELKGVWIGELRVPAGGYDFTWQIATRVEKSSDTINLSARASPSVAF